MLKRIIAVLATATLAIGLALGGATAASAHNPNYDPTCTGFSFNMTAWGATKSNYITFTVDGTKLEDRTKFGDNFVKTYDFAKLGIDPTASHSWSWSVDAQDDGWDRSASGTWIPCANTGLTCEVSTLYKGSALTNGDHINMNVVYPNGNGGSSDVFQVNASVDKAQTPPQDPASESGLVVRIKLPSGNVTLPLTNAQVKSGILSFEYAKGWTGTYSVQWVQYNSMYFNKDNLRKNDLNCGKDTPVEIKTAPSATAPTCTTDGALVLPTISNISWTGGTNGAGPGSYTVKAVPAKGYTLNGAQDAWTIVVKAKGDGVTCEKATEPTLTVATCHPTSGNVVSAYITIPNLTNLSYTIAGINSGARLTPGSNVSLTAGTYTVNVTALNGYTNTGPSSFPVTIAAFDCNKAVTPTLTVAQCHPTTGLLTSAYITIPTTTPGLTYSIAGVNGGQPLTGDVPLAAGSYTVTVAAKAGYTNTGPSTFPIVIAQLTCTEAVQPALTVAYCHPTTGAFQSAYITIPTTTPGLEYRITGVNGGNALTPGSTVNVPAGTTTVLVTEKANVRNTGPGSFAIIVPALSCQSAVEPALTLAECDATTGLLTSASVKISSATPGLEYRIAGINAGNVLPAGSTWNLPAGTHTVTVTAKSGVTNTGAASFTIVVASLTCEQALEPALTIAECDADGKVISAYLVATTTTQGLTYTVRATGAVLQPGVKTPVAAGTYLVDVTTAPGVTNTGPKSFSITVDPLDCNESVEPALTLAVCDVVTGPKSAYVTIPTTTPGLIYSIGGKDYAAGTKVNLPAGPYTVDVRAASGFTNTGKSSFSGTVPAVDCEGEDYVEPVVTPQSCDTDLGGTKNGSLRFTLNADMAYALDGVPVTTALVNGVAAGPHTITVTPAVGHYIKGGVDTFTVTVPAAVGCDGVYTTPLDPFADPEICDPLSDTAEKLDGSITVVHVAGIQWYIGTQADGSDKVAVGTATTTGSVKYDYSAGTYYAFAESKDPSITIKPGHSTWQLTVKVPTPTCIPTLGLFEADAKATGAVCDASGDSRGTITILPTPGVAYAIKGGPALTSTTTKVAPGTYTVVATATLPNATLTADTWVLTVAATSVLCDLETLAFTGQNISGYLVIAIILFQAGLALVAVQFIRARRKARHLAS